MILSLTCITREQSRNLARDPYEVRISAAIATPPSNATPSTDPPVVIGPLKQF